MFELKLPDLGEGVHEAEILKWHAGPGDRIEEDQPLVDVETDKAAVTIPSPRGGLLVSVTGEPGQVVVVGQVIAVIDESGAGRIDDIVLPPGRRPAAPATRRLARELGVSIDLVTPSGPAGRITPDDVKRFAEASAGRVPEPIEQESQPTAGAEPAVGATSPVSADGRIPYFELEPLPDFSSWGPVEREPLRSVRRKIARKMVTSLLVVPHVIHFDEADVTDLDSLRLRHREKRPDGSKLSLLAFVVKAATAALRRARMFNASLDPDRGEIVYKRYYNIGLAADTPRGLIVPVVKDTDRKNVLEIAEQIRELADHARAGTIELEDLRGGTFTITNIGPLGGVPLAPAINYPEVAILGMGRAQEKPVVRDGRIVVRKMLPLTLSFDHRVADGADAARFVSHVIHLLSDPENLLLEV